MSSWTEPDPRVPDPDWALAPRSSIIQNELSSPSIPTTPHNTYLQLTKSSSNPQPLMHSLPSSTALRPNSPITLLGPKQDQHGSGVQFPIEIACHEEIIAQLRIRVAVLENELNHAKREKDDALNASILIARTLGSALSSATFSPSQSYLQNNVNALRKENCALRGELQQRTTEDQDETAWITNIVKKSTRGTERQQGILTSIPYEMSNAASLQSQHHAPDRLLGQQTRSEGHTATNQQTASQHIPLHSSSASDPKAFLPTTNNTSSNPSLTPLPHIPSSPLMVFQNADIRDIGTWSLEDTIGNEDLESPLPTNATIKRTGQFDTPTTDIDAQLREHECGLASLNNVPKPTILKMGFDVGKSRRGEEYRWDPNAPPKWEERWGTAGELHPPRGPKAGSSGLSFRTEGPKDGKFNEQLWDSVDEYHKSLRYHQKNCRDEDLRFPELFRHGHYFIPGETDSNYVRGVLISNLPEDISLREVLLRVRGGEIVSAILTNTVKLTGGMTALVQFAREAAAEEYVSYASAHPITFGDDEQKSEIILLTTPTFPLSIPSRRRIHEHGQTRCLCIRRCPKNIRLNKLERDLACNNPRRAENLVEIFLDEKGDLNLEFASINAAGSAYGILTKWRAYGGLDVVFLPDPCSLPLSDLELPVPPRPPMIPRNQVSFESDDTSSSDSENERRSFGEGGGERKRIAALTHQKVSIPNFNGDKLTTSSWADEVNEASNPSLLPLLEAGTDLDLDTSTHLPAPPNSLDTTALEGVGDMSEDVSKGRGDAIMVENINELMCEKGAQWFRDERFRKPPMGLAGSKYARLVPGFENRKPTSRSRRGSSFGILDGGANVDRDGENGGEERGMGANTPPKLILSDLLASSSEEGMSENSSGSEKSSSPRASSAVVHEVMIESNTRKEKGNEVQILKLDLNSTEMREVTNQHNGKAILEAVTRNPNEIPLDLNDEEDNSLPPPTSPTSPAPTIQEEVQDKALENIRGIA